MLKLNLSLSGLVMIALMTSGCSSTFGHVKSKTFRDREMDYLRQTVVERPSLAIPEGVSLPAFAPHFELPPGPDAYPPQESVMMTPPGYEAHVPVPTETPASKPESGAAATSADTSDSSWFDFFKPKPKPSQAEIDATAAQLRAQIAEIKAQIAAVKAGKSIEPMPKSSASTTASNASPSPQKVESYLKFDETHAGLLTINAPAGIAIPKIKASIAKSGYVITQTVGTSLFEVTPQGATEQTPLSIFVASEGDVTHVSIFDEHQKLATSNEASSLLEQLKANLN